MLRDEVTGLDGQSGLERSRISYAFHVSQMVHPQKRLDLKKALEACIGRLLEVKAVSFERTQLVNEADRQRKGTARPIQRHPLRSIGLHLLVTSDMLVSAEVCASQENPLARCSKSSVKREPGSGHFKPRPKHPVRRSSVTQDACFGKNAPLFFEIF